MVIIIKKGTPKEVIKKRINEVISKTSKKNIKKYAGKLQTNIEPLKYQKSLRSEWE